jgi:hypothetical protein
MKLVELADLIQEIFNSGHVKDYRKLEDEDFQMMVRAANGSIMRTIWEQRNQLDDAKFYFSDQIKSEEYEVGEKDKKGRRTIVLSSDTVRLPKGQTLFGVRPAAEYTGEEFHPTPAGSDWLYDGREEYEGVHYFRLKGSTIILYNCEDSIKKVEVDRIPDDDDILIPNDIAWDILNQVLGVVLKVKGFPVDKTDNNDPDIERIQSRISQSTNPI